MNNLSIMQQALEAIEAMKAEFRALDLPYGSKAYTQANDASHSLRLAIEEAERQEPVGFGKVVGTYGKVEKWPRLPEPAAWCRAHGIGGGA